MWKYNVLDNVQVVTVFNDTIFLLTILAENGSVGVFAFPRTFVLDGLLAGEFTWSSGMNVFNPGNG